MPPRFIHLLGIGALVSAGFTGSAAPAYGTYAWPVQGPVMRGFEPPQDPYGPGHRGIDIAAPFGSQLLAAEEGVVAFAGWVGGSLFISIDHPDGVRSTYSWLSAIDVTEGRPVLRGEAIGRTGRGHADVPTSHLHFGTRIGDTYIDPMLMLERGSVVGLIHLAPLAGPEGNAGVGSGAWVGMTGRPAGWPTYNERSWTPWVGALVHARGPPQRGPGTTRCLSAR